MDEYELSANRYRELKHFCLQYGDYKKELMLLRATDGYLEKHFDPTSALAIRETELVNAIGLIEMTATETERFLSNRVLKVVTQDMDISRLTVPISRECMGELRRRYYYILHKRKGI